MVDLVDLVGLPDLDCFDKWDDLRAFTFIFIRFLA